ncbi:zinc finger protein 98-like [Asbolus verrucosus]|uniref:Zinc finger protein 98-like n=1 Tax=Asbolus verrucosus TaxID=1661398 RepID=A0A482VVR8_ASBVE|nr:zinc finger protein 98-like [Asbolus verrucosus]
MSVVRGFVTAENLQKICKICLEEKAQILALNSIIEFKDINVSSISITDILAKVASPAVNTTDAVENFDPSIICHDCLHELKVAYLFILKYEEADRILQQFLADYVKKEEIVESDNVCEGERSDSDTPVHYETRNAAKNRANKPKKRGRKKKKPTKSEEDAFYEEEINDKNVLHACPICTKEFSALELRDHAHTHKALKKYLSIPADRKVSPTTKFSTKRHLNSPQVTLFKRAKRLHKCPYCNLEFEVEAFRVHIDVHRKQSEFKCDKCERVFKKLNHLNTHRVKHLKEYPYKCEQCGKGFVIKTNYDCHILTHTNDELPHECRYCLKSVCAKAFNNLYNLQVHERIHKGDRCHICTICNKGFLEKSYLKKHMNVHSKI